MLNCLKLLLFFSDNCLVGILSKLCVFFIGDTLIIKKRYAECLPYICLHVWLLIKNKIIVYVIRFISAIAFAIAALD